MLIILSVFLILVIIGSVSASSVNDTQLLSQNIDEVVSGDNTDEILTVEVSSAGNTSGQGLDKDLSVNKEVLKANNNEEKLGATIIVDGSTFADIQAAIVIASAGDTIYLNSTKYLGSGNAITITKDLTIIGCEGCTLDAQGKSRIFACNVPFNLYNLTLTNGSSMSNGGAIYAKMSDIGNSVISGCNFLKNRFYRDYTSSGLYEVYGGAVCMENYNLTLSNCSFVGNTVDITMPVTSTYVYLYGCTLYSSHNANITNCNFNNNYMRYPTYYSNNPYIYGGVIHFASNGTVTNCNFTGNYLRGTGDGSNGYGGAIYFARNGNVTDCNFINNNIDSADSKYRGGGGAIYSSENCTITNCNFTGNHAGEGGAIRIAQNSINVTNCNFKGNGANYGGAIYYFPSTKEYSSITDCNFTSNGAVKNGGAIYFNQNGTITDCNFTSNMANNGYGGAIYFTKNGNVTDCNFTSNGASNGYGGAIYFNQNGTITDCNFTSNGASNGYGGAIYFTKNGNVTDCNFTSNSAKNGGAIRLPGGNVTECNFISNTVTDGNGGAIYFTENGTVTDCNFTNNKGITSTTSKITNGGAIYFTKNGNITDCNFTGNGASNGEGGAIYFARNENVSRCNFTSNSAKNGGAIRLPGGNVTECNFISNTVTDGNGGAIYFTENGNVSDCNFTGNGANNGGAIYFTENGVVSDSIFINNKADSASLTKNSGSSLPTLTFTGNENYINAIYSNNLIGFSNVVYWNGNIVNSDIVSPVMSIQEAGINITFEVYNSNRELVDNVTLITNSAGQVTYDYSKLSSGYYSYKAYHIEDNYYTNTATISGYFEVPEKCNITVLDNQTHYYSSNSARIYAVIKDKDNYSISSDIFVELNYMCPTVIFSDYIEFSYRWDEWVYQQYGYEETMLVVDIDNSREEFQNYGEYGYGYLYGLSEGSHKIMITIYQYDGMDYSTGEIIYSDSFTFSVNKLLFILATKS